MPALLRPELEPIILIWLCMVGACVGSFLNVAVFRVPRKCLSVFRPTWSFCPKCQHAIRWYENIPLVSWVLLRGRCSSCALPIALRYPAVELATTLLFGWLAWHHLHGRIASGDAWSAFVVHAALTSALLTIALIDFDHRIIPDVIDIPGIFIAPLCVAAFPHLLGPHLPDLAGWGASTILWLEGAFRWWGIEAVLRPLDELVALPLTHPVGYLHLAGLAGGVVGAAFGAAVIYGIGAVFTRLLGVDAMGFGDVKLMAFLGGLVGWQGVLITLLVACLTGSAAGLVAMVASGRAQLVGADLRAERTPIRAFALWCTGAEGLAPEGVGDDDPVPRRGGSWLAARLATGDPYVPFGPFLALGGWVASVFPVFVPGVLAS